MQSESTEPLYVQSLTVDKQLLSNVSVLASIDRGSTLTKVLYATEHDSSSWQLHLALFDNKKFHSALRHLKQQKVVQTAAAVTGRKLRVTGVGCNRFADEITKELGLELEFIDEAAAQMSGFHFLVRSFPDSEICHPATEMQLEALDRAEVYRKAVEAEKKAMQEADKGADKFPCLFAIFGSSAGVALVHEDGRVEVKHRHILGGKSFLGLARLLLGACTFDEVFQLAAAGDRGNVDTQISDVLRQAKDSPYGRLPPSMPLFAFGKGVDCGIALSECRPADVAHSLVASFIGNFFAAVALVAKFEKVSRVYFGGNFFRHEVARRETMLSARFHGKEKSLKLQFLRSGHTGAIGALLTSPEAALEFLSSMQLRL